jgi:Domain of unknown function (DUF5130)
MTSSELAHRDGELPVGSVVTLSGRISTAKMVTNEPLRSPFSPVQLALLDEALTTSSRTTGLHFSIYLGELRGDDSRAAAESLHSGLPGPANSVLIAVSPGQRVVEVVTGAESARRLPDRSCRLAVMSMVSFFKEGELIRGLASGLCMLAEQAGAHTTRRTA